MDFLAIQAYPLDSHQCALECTECGALGVCVLGAAKAECWKHHASHTEWVKAGEAS